MKNIGKYLFNEIEIRLKNKRFEIKQRFMTYIVIEFQER